MSRLRFYLGSPNSQVQAAAVEGQDVLLSFAVHRRCGWITQYIPRFRGYLVDSGAYSEFASRVKVDLEEYAAWAEPHRGTADAIAALDDIAGDWKKGMAQWRKYPWMFPTYHSSDPPEVLQEILSHRPRWLGLGMVPPRTHTQWLRETLEVLSDHPAIHVHGWALGKYRAERRLDSVDSTNWWRDGMQLRKDLPWLTYAECLDLIVKRYQREPCMRALAATPQREDSLSLENFWE